MTLRLGSAPVCWGIFEFEGIEPRYAWNQVLDEMAETGYQGTELGPYGYLPTQPEQLRDELNRRGLQLLSAFVPVELARAEAHEAGLREALRVGRLLQALGLADANGSVPDLVARAGRRHGCQLRDWSVYGRGVDHIATSLHQELGLSVVFHHHCAGYVETPAEIQALLEHSEVSLCLDTGHWHYAGGDAVECLRQWGSRVGYVHFKDCQPEVAARCRREELDYFGAVQAGVFCPLGEGEVDFAGVLRELERLHYDGWAVVEQDVLVDDLEAPRRFSQQNREFLRGLGV